MQKSNKKTTKANGKGTAQPPAKPATQAKPAAKPAVSHKVNSPSRPAAPVAEVSKAIQVKVSSEMSTQTKPQKLESILVTPKKSSKKKVLFVASECFPFSGTGGLGEVMASLPRAINESKSNLDCRVVLPLYECVPASIRSTLEFVGHIGVPLAWRNQYCGVFKAVYNNVTYYLLDNEYYFKRPNLYGYYDDGERFAFFSRAALEILTVINFMPDIISAQDWQTALVPIFYKLYYQFDREGYGNIVTNFTIHNIEYQGKYSKSILEDVLGISSAEYGSVEHKGCVNLIKGALDYSDYVSTVSPTYANELMMPFYAHGLEDILNKNKHKIKGILNGIDVETYNAAKSNALFVNYDAKSLGKKEDNKKQLQAMLGLPVKADVPLVAIISRLVSHKGLDLVRLAIEEILAQDIQVVVLGKGDPDYENFFSHLQQIYANKLCSVIAFNKDLSQKIYAGSDMFLMPSKSEPCGLSQMIACKYATIPIVRSTGGLADSIVDCGDGTIGNGFVFGDYTASDMMHSIYRAIGLYRDYPHLWKELMARAIATDFSWSSSAREYIQYFNSITK